jgi:putative hydrolase of HD superfamily
MRREKAPTEKSVPLKDVPGLANFVYEVGILSNTPRSGLWFLGTGKQSVAEHLLRTAYIAYALAYFYPKIDRSKVVLMALMHDLGEGRTSDHNYVHQKYGRLSESSAIADMAATVPFGPEIHALYAEEQARLTPEARLVKDADQLEWIATLRHEEVKGNKKARAWANIAIKRLKTPAGKQLGRALMTTHPDAWWFNENDSWFVDRVKKAAPKKKR